jgi:hypothetical protein
MSPLIKQMAITNWNTTSDLRKVILLCMLPNCPFNDGINLKRDKNQSRITAADKTL